MRGALTRRFFRNLEIPRSRPRLGQAAGRSHAGSPHSLSRENESTIFESISDGVTAFYVQAAECAFCGLPAAIASSDGAMMPILDQVKFGSRYKSGFPGLLGSAKRFSLGTNIPFAARQLRRP